MKKAVRVYGKVVYVVVSILALVMAIGAPEVWPWG
jgi:hypothetical protein